MLEKIRNILKKPALRQGTVVLADQGFLSVATFLTGVMVARATTKEEYSFYVLTMSVVFILQGAQRALISLPYTILAPSLDEREQKIYFGNTLLHTFMLCAILATCLILLYVINAGDTKVSLYNYLPLAAFVLAAYTLREHLRTAMLARLHVWGAFFPNFTGTVLQLGLVVYFFVAGMLAVKNALWILAICSTLAAGMMFYGQWNSLSVSVGKSWDDFLRSWDIGKWTLGNVLWYVGASESYTWLVLFLLDKKAVAAYGVCFATASILAPFLRGANAYMLPRMVHGYRDRNTANLVRLLRLSVIVISIPYGLWLVLGILFGEKIITLLYSQTYAGYGILMSILIGKTLIESAATPVASALQTIGRSDATTKSLILGSCVSLSVGPAMIWKLGLLGACIASVISSAAHFAWKWYILKKTLHV